MSGTMGAWDVTPNSPVVKRPTFSGLVGWLFAKLPTYLAELNDVPLGVDPIANDGTVE
jgi:hypothetical protein